MRCIGHTLEAPLPEGSRQDLGRREEGEESHIRHTYMSLSLCPSIINYWQCLDSTLRTDKHTQGLRSSQ